MKQGSRCQKEKAEKPNSMVKRSVGEMLFASVRAVFRTRWTEWEKLVPLYISMIPLTMQYHEKDHT
jgi:hypothetical protein